MKKVYSILFVLTSFMSINAYAEIVNISVTNFQFTPANVNVVVGDIVRFTFVSGFHNASARGISGGRPAGAAILFSGSPNSVTTYDYTVTKAGVYLYVCEVHGDTATYTGMKGQFTASSSLPVILKNFQVQTIEKKPLLTWTTATEVNADYFSVRSSTDAINFTEVSRISAVGNSNKEQSYSFADNNLIANSKFIYYELAIVDKDGKQKLSDIKMFKNTLAINKLITRIGPNPITRPGQLMVYFNSEKTGTMQVKVFNAEGKMLLNTNMEAVPGLNSGHVHVCDFNPGVYTLLFSMDGLKEMKKVLVN